MSGNVSETVLRGNQRRAVELVAQDDLTDIQIAAEVHVTERTLERWKKLPAFIAAVEDAKQQITAAIRAEGIANKQNRIDALNDRWTRLRGVIEARAADLADVPGGSTGLLVRQYKSVGVGQDMQLVEEYAVDTGLLREAREHEKQAAQELSQWAERQVVEGEMTVTRIIGVPDEELA